MTENLEHTTEELDRSIELHTSIISFYKKITLERLPEYEKQVIIDTIAKEETWLNKLVEERRHRS